MFYPNTLKKSSAFALVLLLSM